MAETNSKLANHRIFVCYNENKQNNAYAEIIYNILETVGVKAFVAHIERNKYSEDFDQIREKIIPASEYFIYINTQGAFSRPEVQKEFKMAYPNGTLTNNPTLLVFRHDSAEFSNAEFEKATGLKLGGYNQPKFNDENELVVLIKNIIKKYVLESQAQKEKKLKIKKYLEYCESLINTRNKVDGRILEDLYVVPKSVVLDRSTWKLPDNEIVGTNWNVEEHFLKVEKEKRVYVAASYGIGKTSWCYQLAAKLAKNNNKELYSDFFPIYVPLKYAFSNVGSNNTVDEILSWLDIQTKVLFIYDGLDEYGNFDDHISMRNFEDQINVHFKFYESKQIITSRLDDFSAPPFSNINRYVRLLPFEKEEVNTFFRKYGVDLDYITISGWGLESDEIGKPLFCWMIAFAHSNNPFLFKGTVTLNRTILFFTVIHDIILGKHDSEADEYGYKKHALNEKRALRKIAELKNLYEGALTKRIILKALKNSDSYVNQEILNVFDRLIWTYMNTKQGNDYDEYVEFIHRSFKEYLLAEYYIECFVRSDAQRINLKLPSQVTIQFLDGLLQLLKPNTNNFQKYAERFAKSYEEKYTIDELRLRLIRVSISCFEDERIILNGRITDLDISDSYETLFLYRFISVMMLNGLGEPYEIGDIHGFRYFKPDGEKFLKMLRASHMSVPSYILYLDKIDLSGMKFENETPNYILCNANLANSTFHGNFYGTNFSGADLSKSKIKQGTHFNSCNFSGANLTGIEAVTDSPISPHFSNCDFSNCKLIAADLPYSRFSDCDFSGADLSGAEIDSSIFSSCDLRNVKFNDNTNTKNIELWGKDDGTGLNKEWDDLKLNEKLVQYLLSKVDVGFREKILKDNPQLNFGNNS